MKIINAKTKEDIVKIVGEYIGNKEIGSLDAPCLFISTEFDRNQINIIKELEKDFENALFIECLYREQNRDKYHLMINSIVGMFRYYTFINSTAVGSTSLEKRKELLSYFEKAVKSIRYNLKEITEILSEAKDDLELLVEISEIYNPEECYENLIKVFLQIYHKKNLVIIFNKMVVGLDGK